MCVFVWMYLWMSRRKHWPFRPQVTDTVTSVSPDMGAGNETPVLSKSRKDSTCEHLSRLLTNNLKTNLLQTWSMSSTHTSSAGTCTLSLDKKTGPLTGDLWAQSLLWWQTQTPSFANSQFCKVLKKQNKTVLSWLREQNVSPHLRLRSSW